MTSTPLLNLSALLDDAKCFALIRQHRWPDGVRCPTCGSAGVARHGRDDTQPHRQRYRCTACAARFDDLSGTVLAGHHQPLRVWVLCLYLMGLNLSNRQIAHELDLGVSDVQAMTEQLRAALVANTPAVTLEGEVEVDEVYVVAGHKGHPGGGGQKGRLGRRRRLKGAPGRGTLAQERPPVLGLIQHGGEVVLHMLANVRQPTIRPFIETSIATGTLVHTDDTKSG